MTDPQRDPPRDTSSGPNKTSRCPSTKVAPGGRRSSTSTMPSRPMTGVGSISAPADSLYKLTLPPMTGVPKASQASDMPSMASESCHMTSGCSGFPKFKQFTTASGRAPTQARFMIDSATTLAVPARGSTAHQRWLPSVVMAKARPVSTPVVGCRSLSTEASSPGPITVFRNSWWSYWRYTQAGSTSKPRRAAPGSIGAGRSAAAGPRGFAGAARGRS